MITLSIDSSSQKAANKALHLTPKSGAGELGR